MFEEEVPPTVFLIHTMPRKNLIEVRSGRIAVVVQMNVRALGDALFPQHLFQRGLLSKRSWSALDDSSSDGLELAGAIPSI